MSDPSVGEVGGTFAGLVALLVALGHGLRWAMGWNDRRAATRSAKLDAWQRQLDERERRIDQQQEEHWARVEAQMKALTDWNEQLHKEHAALLGGYQILAAALRVIDPENHALKMADDLLRSAFPLEPVVPPDMSLILKRVARSDEPSEGD